MPVRGEPMPSAAQGLVGQLGGRPPAPETIASPGFSLKDYARPRHENQLSLYHKKWTNEWGQLRGIGSSWDLGASTIPGAIRTSY